MVCKTCGGNRTKERCNICEILGANQSPGGHDPKGWPKESVALSVMKNQVKEANARAKKHGLTGVYYEPSGKCILSDRGARRDLLRLEQMHDNNGGYGD